MALDAFLRGGTPTPEVTLVDDECYVVGASWGWSAHRLVAGRLVNEQCSVRFADHDALARIKGSLGSPLVVDGTAADDRENVPSVEAVLDEPRGRVGTRRSRGQDHTSYVGWMALWAC